MTPDPELDSIVLRAFPDGRVHALHALSGGLSARAVHLDVLTRDGRHEHVVVRRPSADSLDSARRIAEKEYRVLQFAWEGQLRVPKPRYFDRQTAAIVLDHVAGDPYFAPADTQDMLRQMASALAQLHQLPIGDDLAGVPRRSERLSAYLEQVPTVLDESLNETLVRARLAERYPWPNDNRSALLHGDYWPGNLIWRDRTLHAVIDWEECSVGDPLADVALARLDVLWAFGDDAMLAFTHYYQEQSTLDWSNLPYWELSVALRPMSQLERWASAYAPPPICRPDITADTMRDGHRRFVARALANLPAL